MLTTESHNTQIIDRAQYDAEDGHLKSEIDLLCQASLRSAAGSADTSTANCVAKATRQGFTASERSVTGAVKQHRHIRDVIQQCSSLFTTDLGFDSREAKGLVMADADGASSGRSAIQTVSGYGKPT